MHEMIISPWLINESYAVEEGQQIIRLINPEEFGSTRLFPWLPQRRISICLVQFHVSIFDGMGMMRVYTVDWLVNSCSPTSWPMNKAGNGVNHVAAGGSLPLRIAGGGVRPN